MLIDILYGSNNYCCLCSCRENCAWKTQLSGFKVLSTRCVDNCRTKFGGLRYAWRMYNQDEITGERLEYTNLADISDSGKPHFRKYYSCYIFLLPSRATMV